MQLQQSSNILYAQRLFAPQHGIEHLHRALAGLLLGITRYWLCLCAGAVPSALLAIRRLAGGQDVGLSKVQLEPLHVALMVDPLATPQLVRRIQLRFVMRHRVENVEENGVREELALLDTCLGEGTIVQTGAGRPELGQIVARGQRKVLTEALGFDAPLLRLGRAVVGGEAGARGRLRRSQMHAAVHLVKVLEHDLARLLLAMRTQHLLWLVTLPAQVD